MTVRGIHHVGIAVADLDEALATYERLFGATLEHRSTVPDQGVQALSVLVGEDRIELVELIQNANGDGWIERPAAIALDDE